MVQKASAPHRALTYLFLLAFAFSLPGPLGLMPTVAAASSSASKRIIKKLKKQIAAARSVPPTPAAFVEMVKVGNAGNGTDAGNASAASVYGAVPYEYSIGNYEVTLAQYTVFFKRGGGDGRAQSLQCEDGDGFEQCRDRPKRKSGQLHLRGDRDGDAPGDVCELVRRGALLQLAAQRAAERGAGCDDDGERSLSAQRSDERRADDHAQSRGEILDPERG